MHRHRSFALILLVALVFAAGCQNRGVHFEDSIDLDFDLCIHCRHYPDDLHLPYVTGANVTVWAHPDEPDDLSLYDTWFASSDPSVFTVANSYSDEGTASARIYAVRGGVADLILYRSREKARVVARRSIQVAVPDSVELYFAGFPAIGMDVENGFVGEETNVLEGGTATFLVHYFKDGERLYGHEVLQPQAADPDSVWVERDATFLWEDREWLRVTPEGPGEHPVDLYVVGKYVGSLLVNATAPEDVTRVRLFTPGERGVAEDEDIGLLAIGYSVLGEPVYGIDFEWTSDGDTVPRGGDIYEYEFEAGGGSVVTATFGDAEASAVVHQEEDSGWVWDSDYVGCSAGATEGDANAMLPGVLLLGFLAVFLVRRASRKED